MYNHCMSVKIISHIALIVFIYYCVYHIYSGIMNPVPSLGDSWDYHIPIAQTILDGSFLSLNTAKLSQWFYPGSGELPLALFLTLHLPLTLSNILPIVILFFALWRFGYPKLEYYYSLFFSLTVVTLNGVIRWMNAVSIDIWVAVFFTSLLILFEQPRKTTFYYLLLGLFSGLLIGSKYPGLILLLILVVVYHQSILRSISLKRLGVFLIPFSIFGLFWYGRNYVMTGNPIYPLPLFSLPSVPLFSTRVIDVLLTRPIEFMNAFFAEYKVWSLLILLIPFILLIKKTCYRSVCHTTASRRGAEWVSIFTDADVF